METGIERISVPEPIYNRPIQELREVMDSYGWTDVKEKDAEPEDDGRAPLPYYMGVVIDLLA